MLWCVSSLINLVPTCGAAFRAMDPQLARVVSNFLLTAFKYAAATTCVLAALYMLNSLPERNSELRKEEIRLNTAGNVLGQAELCPSSAGVAIHSFKHLDGTNYSAALDWRKLPECPKIEEATTCECSNRSTPAKSTKCVPPVLPADEDAVFRMMGCIDDTLFADLGSQYYTSGVPVKTVVTTADNNANGVLECAELASAARAYVKPIFWAHDKTQRVALEGLIPC